MSEDPIKASVNNLIETYICDVQRHYAELAMKLPPHIKGLTIRELREIGGDVNPDIVWPKSDEDRLKKQTQLNLILAQVHEEAKNYVVNYYKNVINDLPAELLKKKINDLSDDEWALWGPDMLKIRNKLQSSSGGRK